MIHLVTTEQDETRSTMTLVVYDSTWQAFKAHGGKVRRAARLGDSSRSIGVYRFVSLTWADDRPQCMDFKFVVNKANMCTI